MTRIAWAGLFLLPLILVGCAAPAASVSPTAVVEQAGASLAPDAPVAPAQVASVWGEVPKQCT
jgi:hypothetical protein